ncbi:MAG: hypothetical protein AAFQ41_09525 [Cyanobacteria bacterium J06623_7]
MKTKQLLVVAILTFIMPLAVSCSDNGSDNISDSQDEGREVARRTLECEQIADTDAQLDCLRQIQEDFANDAIR